MEVASRSRLDMKVKAEDDSGDVRMADDKPTYRSWKKKYRKMRIMFDQKMHEGEELHRLEQKALATAKRLAVQKECVFFVTIPFAFDTIASLLLTRYSQSVTRSSLRCQQLGPDPARQADRPQPRAALRR
jgi:hypothetical protein